MLLDGPCKHLTTTNQTEEEGSNGHGHHTEEEPFGNLDSVVGTGDQVEQKALGNSTDRSALWSQVTQDNVANQVEDHHQNDQTGKNVGIVLIVLGNGRRVQWVQGGIGNVVGTGSVVASVLENVEQWHVTVAKLVNKQSLQLSLHKVDNEEEHGHELSIVQGGIGCGVVRAVQIRSQQVNDGEGGQWAKVLDEEDGAIADLWSQVLEDDAVTVLENGVQWLFALDDGTSGSIVYVCYVCVWS